MCFSLNKNEFALGLLIKKSKHTLKTKKTGAGLTFIKQPQFEYRRK